MQIAVSIWLSINNDPKYLSLPNYTELLKSEADFRQEFFKALIQNAEDNMIIYMPAKTIRGIDIPVLVVNKEIYMFLTVKD